MKFISVVIVTAASASAAGAIRYVPIEYRVVDHPDTQSLQLIYENRSAHRICIGAENWPSRDGIIDNSGDEFYLEVHGKKYFLQKEQDYCPNCVTELSPRRTIDSKLNYKSFELPEPVFKEPKTLHLKSIGYVC